MSRKRISRTTGAKLAISTILAIAAIIISLQNTAPVETRILFATVTMSAALLLLCVLTIGIVIGMIAATFLIRKPSASE